MKVSDMTTEQKKQRLEELEKIKTKRKLTFEQALDLMQISKNWSDKQTSEFAKQYKEFKPIYM